MTAAKRIGLPEIDSISDPARLAQLVETARRMLDRATADCPLRDKVAMKAYAQDAEDRMVALVG